MDNWIRYISIAAKAGKVRSGGEQAARCIEGGKAKLVIIAEDASPGSAGKTEALCQRHGVPVITGPGKETLGNLCGRDMRSAVIITDKGIAEAILQKMEGGR